MQKINDIMDDTMKRYNPSEIEPKWQKIWQDTEIYKTTEDKQRKKYVMLTEFPYPSGDGLHLGHVREYTLGDIMARNKRMQGYNVLYPMGYDAFGLPTENYAIKHKIAPQLATERNVANFQAQFSSLGFSIDWDRSFRTTDPSYYKWTQWLFLQFFKAGLAYQDEIAINWCPHCKTGLANEEVVNGRHERCDTLVEKRMLNQWLLKITHYADRLIDGLKDVDYPSRIADQQINWIGRSRGAEVQFKIEGSSKTLTVFTTRPDTIFGATFMVIAPEHPLVPELTTAEQKSAINAYVLDAQRRSDIERMDTSRKKTGVFTGSYAINPATKQPIPIWVADYVLMGYGTGAIMAVPAHDERDFDFAKKFDLPIRQIIMPCEADGHNPPQEGFEEVTRDTVVVHLRDKSTGRFALLNWHESLEGITTAIMGGIEEGQTPEEAALMEIEEEAALKGVRIIKKSSWITGSKYCASHKGENRKAIAYALLAEVDNLEDQGHIPDEERKKHTLVWAEQHEVATRLTPDHQKQVWELLWTDTSLPGEGEMINSGPYDGIPSSEAREKIVADLEKQGVAKTRVNYKLRDWIFSRQHYWGEPIPIIHCPKHGAVGVPEDQLPVELPKVDHYEPTDTGESPLAAIESWVNTTCPTCGGPAKRETDTMPNWAGSSWYYLRYFDAHNDKQFVSKEALDYWQNVDLYLGGMEHTTLHLLYSRFWHQFLYDKGLVPTPEPYQARRGQGIVLAADGTKMSKSKGNVVNPNDVLKDGYGADALRVAIAFLAPYDQTTPWNPEGVVGTYRFLNRIWTLTQEALATNVFTTVDTDGAEAVAIISAAHKVTKKVTEDLHDMGFNTAVAALMEYTNELYKLKVSTSFAKAPAAWQYALRTLVQLVAPFAPHVAEELWQEIGEETSVHVNNWPLWDEKYLVEDIVTIVVQVNGKVRANIEAPSDVTKEQVEQAALMHEKVQQFVAGKTPTKVIYIPGRLINIVISNT